MGIQKVTLEETKKLHLENRLVGAFELSNAAYHAAPGLSKSALDDINESPAFYRWRLLNPSQWTEALIFGSAYHAKLLEPHTFDSLFYPTDSQPKAPKADSQGRMPLGERNMSKIEGMLKVYRENQLAMKLITGFREISFFWTDEDTGILCKCKPDVVIPQAGIISDNKTTMNANPQTFQKSIMDNRYYVQASFALDGVRKAQEQSGDDFGIKTPDVFVFVAQEKDDPHTIETYQIGPQSLVLGDEDYKKNLELYAKCINDNHWPTATDGKIQEIELPTWMIIRRNT